MYNFRVEEWSGGGIQFRRGYTPLGWFIHLVQLFLLAHRRWVLLGLAALSILLAGWVIPLVAWWQLGWGPDWLGWPLTLWPLAIPFGWGLVKFLTWALSKQWVRGYVLHAFAWPFGWSWIEVQPRRPRQRRWSGTRPYWIVSVLTAVVAGWWTMVVWNPLGWTWLGGLIGSATVLYLALFLYNSAQKPNPQPRHGHAIQYETGPHPIGFFPMLLKVGMIPMPYIKLGIKEEKDKFIILVKLVLAIPLFGLKLCRILLGLGPITWVAGSVLVLRFGPENFLNPWWWAFMVVLTSYWILFAAFGWRKILYRSTLGPNGIEKDGDLVVRFPHLTLFGVLDYGDEIRGRERVAVSHKETHFGSIVDIDPGFALTLGAEKVRVWWVDERKFPI